MSQPAGSKISIRRLASTLPWVPHTHKENVVNIIALPKMNDTTIKRVKAKKTGGIPNASNRSWVLWERRSLFGKGFPLIIWSGYFSPCSIESRAWLLNEDAILTTEIADAVPPTLMRTVAYANQRIVRHRALVPVLGLCSIIWASDICTAAKRAV